MDNHRTNEIKRILEFFDRVEKAYSQFNADVFGLYKKDSFFMDVFLISDNLDETVFFTEKMNYIKMIDSAIAKMAGAGWNTDKVIETLKNIQMEIVKLDYENRSDSIDFFTKDCMKYREMLILFEGIYDNLYGEKGLEQQKVNALLEKVSELIQELESFPWEAEAKMAIKYQLFSVQESINKYSLFGKQALEKEINALLGSVIIEVSNAKSVSEEERGFVKKVMEFVKDANATAKFVENLAMYSPALLEIIDKL